MQLDELNKTSKLWNKNEYSCELQNNQNWIASREDDRKTLFVLLFWTHMLKMLRTLSRYIVNVLHVTVYSN